MPAKQPNDAMANLTLGQTTEYPEQYDASLLQPVPRSLNRLPIGIEDNDLPFHGVDEWTGYELSWLTSKGLPQVAIARFVVPVTSPNLIESKSFKLYLNSFNQSRFADWQQVQQTMAVDLSRCAGAPVDVLLYSLEEFAARPIAALAGQSIDQQDIEIEHYQYQPGLLRLVDEHAEHSKTADVSEVLCSDLLKSNCLITNQPDWGSVSIAYSGPQIDRASLLRYLVSFRGHNEFHEQCVERIFQDLRQHCRCQQLTVTARYTRRGGLDINPLRSTSKTWPESRRGVRQ
ncbi:NADPH-dependent 7-cyano-7-deazaguanine reductase QueF [Aliidiomarina sedimenti]|uniref:NADPH-dependent 7-cyano-7-deazaguanine reductase n=1 Tax=Aliidiomarina sedimenti TaxID=1933879 RepID=A0ABY0C2H3_9GAMM|nr:NADPH-dependent 7-cyano-7-deazaguanine reductase QueF [Aliidiomarina sedimenti]RUO32052.1 NADPH-dependent 7-cyano-7-deazaguanine reductase QueF [Aliidiomarina sedimenti]